MYMNCTTCRALVSSNPTGTCLGCQRGFTGTPQEDAFDTQKYKYQEPLELRLKKEAEKAFQRWKDELAKQEDKENANEIAGTKKMDARKQTQNGKELGKRKYKRKKASNKSKTKKK